jgi:hypothetical protein
MLFFVTLVSAESPRDEEKYAQLNLKKALQPVNPGIQVPANNLEKNNIISLKQLVQLNQDILT